VNHPSTVNMSAYAGSVSSRTIQDLMEAGVPTFKWLFTHAMHLCRRLRQSKGPMNISGLGSRWSGREKKRSSQQAEGQGRII
jgi:hypothetical protein